MNIFRVIKFIAMILFLLYVAFFLVVNTDPVTVKIPPWPEMKIALSIVFIVAFLLGLTMTGLFSMVELFKQNRKYRKIKKQNTLLEKEIENLRKEPLLDSAESGKNSEDQSSDEFGEMDSPLDEETLNRIR